LRSVRKKGWKQEAYEMYYGEHMQINDIASKLKMSRQAVSNHLRSYPTQFNMEKESRKMLNNEKRKESKRAYSRKYRAENKINADTIKREHETAARILSYERIY
jgi:predicted DNA-binding protein YlxM (UPF0122 family)